MDTLHQILASPVWIDVAKVIFVAVMLTFAVLSIVISIKFQSWHQDLCLLEEAAGRARDDVMFEMTALRKRLNDLNERFESRTQPTKLEETTKLIRDAGSVLWLVMAKERSMFQWGIAGFKVVKDALKFMKQQGNH